MLYDIYCDESRQDLLANKNSISSNNYFCCIGGILLPNNKRSDIKNDIKKIKNSHGIHSELKWGTVSSNKIDCYIDLVDYFFSNNDLSFRTVVIDARKVDNATYNCSDHELGYYKFYYQLLIHWLDRKEKYYVFTDQKTNKERNRLQELKRISNLSINNSECISILQAIDSKESLLLQLANILIGAVGYKYNWMDEGLSTAKNQLIAKIEYNLNRQISATARSEVKFNVFNINLREGCK